MRLALNRGSFAFDLLEQLAAGSIMRIVFVGFVNKKLFSGGRYHACMMAEASAASGHDVVLWLTDVPRFWDDFAMFPQHEAIAVHVDPDFANPPKGPFDLVVVIPDLRDDHRMYQAALSLAEHHAARVALLSFETPNWFNRLSPQSRDEALWFYWREVARNADVVLTSCEEGRRFAEQFYGEVSHNAIIVSCPPSINSLAAKSIGAVERKKQIICVTRIGDRHSHKGADTLTRLMDPELNGYELILLAGTEARPDHQTLNALTDTANRTGMTLRFVDYACEQEKFQLIKQSTAMVVPSYFEGFGYPPVEALYCHTPCIAFDLDVYDETCGASLIRVPPGRVDVMRRKLIDLCKADEEPYSVEQSPELLTIAPFSHYIERLEGVYSAVMNAEFAPRNQARIAVKSARMNRRSFAQRIQQHKMFQPIIKAIESIEYFLFSKVFISRTNLLRRIATDEAYFKVFCEVAARNKDHVQMESDMPVVRGKRDAKT